MAKDVKELMAKVGKIKILTSRLVDDRLSGDYHSTFKGQGVEFDEVRPYEPGDDVRSIDWNVTARMDAPYVKRYSEERELTVLFVVDVSGSQSYGSRSRTKAELSAEVAALLALTAIRNQDKVGLVLFSDRIVKYIPPRKGRDFVMRLVREVLAAGEDARGGTDFEGVFRFLAGVQKRRAVVFMVSDFMGIEKAEKLLRLTAARHDLVCAAVSDPAEETLPDAGLVELEDPETGEARLVDTSNPRVRRAFAERAAAERAEIFGFFRKSGIDTLDLSTSRQYIDAVRALFKRRASKSGGRRG
ncbi:MAG: DUF58 domain-containing protein [Kiritimatiellae bacterium]|nr:DUF58 domain-containing protein [Kiritimatiellia bacterium]